MAEAMFLLRTQWNYREYEEAPDDLVTAMILYMNAEIEVARSRRDDK